MASSAETEKFYQAALGLYRQGRNAEGAQALGRAASGGHVEAMSVLGSQLLSGQGIQPDLAAGAFLIMAAAERGGGRACAMAAALLASGVGGVSDWPRALDLLQRSAELGHSPAQDQLRLLANPENPAPDVRWAELRRAVDLNIWRSTPSETVLHADPLVRGFDGMLAPAVCDWMIARGRDRLRPAQVYDAQLGGPATNSERRNSAAEFALADMDLVLLAVRERLAGSIGLPTTHFGALQVLHYAVGERFTPHYDFLDPAFEGHARDLALRGQRVATLLVYLNEDLEGGETDFPELGLRHRGGRGAGMAFSNVDTAGQPDRRTLHAGLPPTSGEKWLLSQWVRDRPAPGVGDPRLTAILFPR